MKNIRSIRPIIKSPKTTKIKPEAYVVFKGRIPGVYTSLQEVLNQTCDFPLACYHPYATLDDANNAYQVRKKRQHLTIEDLLENSKQPCQNQESKRTYLRPLLCWLINKQKYHSHTTLLAIVKIAKQLSANNNLNVQLLGKALQKYNPPPWFQ